MSDSTKPRRVCAAGVGNTGLPVMLALSANPQIKIVSILCGGNHDGAEIMLADDRIIEATSSIDRALTSPSDRGGPPDVLLDMTNFKVAYDIITHATAQGIDVVSGTSNLEPDKLRLIADAAPEDTCLFWVPSAAKAMVLSDLAVQMAARFAFYAAVLEIHRAEKPDIPSGVAAVTCTKLGPSQPAPFDPIKYDVKHANAAGAVIEGMQCAGFRLPGYLADQLAFISDNFQRYEPRYTIWNPAAYAVGLGDALLSVGGMKGLVVGLEQLYMGYYRRDQITGEINAILDRSKETHVGTRDVSRLIRLMDELSDLLT